MLKEDFLNPEKLSDLIKNLPCEISGLAPIEEAISTVGGISLNAIDSNFELMDLKNHYVIGEMLNYDAPTGGYLLQSCFTMAKFLAQTLNNRAFH
ncbi:MAG: NAD(P)/FAD-dependent oxidoreductase [Bacteroidota bacterium]